MVAAPSTAAHAATTARLRRDRTSMKRVIRLPVRLVARLTPATPTNGSSPARGESTMA